MFTKIKRKTKNVIYRINEYKQFCIRPKRMAYLFGSPYHKNMGDQAQTYCIQKWLKKNYPEYGLMIFTLRDSSERVYKLLRRFIRKEDLLICHSGYHITDLYDERLPYMELAKRFKDHRIVVFPQTVFFNDETKLLENARVFNEHGNLLLMCRDQVSYEEAKKHFNACKIMLMPDIVTTLIGEYKFDGERDGVLFCMRNDKEAFYSKEKIDGLRIRFFGVHTEMTDTTLSDLEVNYILQNRESILMRMFQEYSQYKVVITDRYHGTIFSLIAGTPVVVLGSTDHKLSSGVQWFPKEFSDYVSFANNLEDAYQKAMYSIQRNDLTYTLPPYFKEKYYDNLKSEIQRLFS